MNKIHFLLLIAIAVWFMSCAQESNSNKPGEERNITEKSKPDKQGIQLIITEIADTTIAGVGDRVRIEIAVANNKQKGNLEISGYREHMDSVVIQKNKIVVFREVTSLRDSTFQGTVYCRKNNRLQSKADFEINFPTRELRIELINLTSEEYFLNQAHELSLEVEKYDNVRLNCTGGVIRKQGHKWEFTPTSTERVKLSLIAQTPEGLSFILHQWDLEVKEL